MPTDWCKCSVCRTGPMGMTEQVTDIIRKHRLADEVRKRSRPQAPSLPPPPSHSTPSAAVPQCRCPTTDLDPPLYVYDPLLDASYPGFDLPDDNDDDPAQPASPAYSLDAELDDDRDYDPIRLQDDDFDPDVMEVDADERRPPEDVIEDDPFAARLFATRAEVFEAANSRAVETLDDDDDDDNPTPAFLDDDPAVRSAYIRIYVAGAFQGATRPIVHSMLESSYALLSSVSRRSGLELRGLE
ncbi:hypothetical protein FA95DRAFT_1613137, partial [Auriscalpium vulgare]